ncbi:hypothetical protein BC477_00060 [Clavibacter michiganensis subsp. michiganensis]|uniref:Uncharacterized protein n=1 Tax=Clavibacter michiganensis subsp. michiganensis TaxID=33013 RepID=A0A251XGK4_CLAMM|nr:hypothetical protein BC477_00060 [Clavibacter michiganensis subsp. michiganensis]OUE01033.1 hypothetical protein CMMCAS07_16455 [Clavibacter michiganensis subsp. michiganensis]
MRQPGNRASTSATRAASTAGIVAFTSTWSRKGAGGSVQPKSMAAASQAADSASSYSMNGENSVQPSGPSMSRASRTSRPRKRVRSGRATTRAVASRSSRAGSMDPASHPRAASGAPPRLDAW